MIRLTFNRNKAGKLLCAALTVFLAQAGISQAGENQDKGPSPAALARKISEILKTADVEALQGLLLEEVGDPVDKKAPLPPVEIAPTVHPQDAEIRKQLQGVDLTGVKQLRSSPNGELAAGLTGLYDNPGPRSGSFSLVKGAGRVRTG